MKKLSQVLIIAIVALVALMIGLSSCKPSLETCNRLYPPHIIEKVKDSVSYQKEYVSLPGDTSYIILPFNCVEDSLRRVIELYRGKVGNYETTISWFNGQLKMTQKRFADSLAVWNKHSEKVQEKIVEKPVDRIVLKVPKWCRYLLGVNLFAIILFILYKRFKN